MPHYQKNLGHIFSAQLVKTCIDSISIWRGLDYDSSYTVRVGIKTFELFFALLDDDQKELVFVVSFSLGLFPTALDPYKNKIWDTFYETRAVITRGEY